ncbi:MAG: hypothetical protein ACRC5V_11820, partial [Aeromonas sp.]
GGRSDGVCERNKQTEHPWSACKKAPSVAVTWGWGSHELLADLGNNASVMRMFSDQKLGGNVQKNADLFYLFVDIFCKKSRNVSQLMNMRRIAPVH